jgi:exopolyphosphatase / guanosine-5'-triphosphate,3'-diphosphate pyrophosphatase
VDAVKAVSRVESGGWVARLAEDPAIAEGIEPAHRSYAAERGEMISGAEEWGGVGGTRRGIKCLHAHYAYHLAGGDDVVGRWTAARVEPIHAEERGGRVAAIDQGTNSTRLLVLEPRGPGEDPREIARDMRITRLGRDVGRTGRLAPGSIEQTVDAVARFARRARALHAERLRLGATSAVRDASNREEFFQPVRELIGSEPEVIDGEREAGLSFLGGTRGLAGDLGPFLLIDIGGGSTEFVIGREPAVAERAISTQLGSVRLTEQVGPSDPPSADDLRAFGALIAPRLDEAERAVPVREARVLVAVAGTATTLQACSLGLE